MGLTLRTEGESRRLVPISQIKNHVVAYYGGIAAEELIFGRSEVTTGASQDIKEASFWIREYLRYGSVHGLLDEESFTGRPNSESSLEEAQKLSKELYDMAKQFLLERQELLQCVAQALLRKDAIGEDGFDQLIAQGKLSSTPAAG